MEEKLGILRGLWRIFSFWKLRKALGLVRAADQQFTGSVEGIRDAFELHRDKLVSEYRGLRDAVAQVESVLEDRRTQLENLNHREKELLRNRDGAMVLVENTEDIATREKHAAAFERYDAEIQSIEERQKSMQAEIEENGRLLGRHMGTLTRMQAEIERLPREQVSAVADFISAKKIKELNDRLQGIQTSMDRGPIQAVIEANRKLTSEARISEKLASVDVHAQDTEYAQAGTGMSSRSRLDEMLAARKAERAGVEIKPDTSIETARKDRPDLTN